jgi:hypothetical protein
LRSDLLRLGMMVAVDGAMADSRVGDQKGSIEGWFP